MSDKGRSRSMAATAERSARHHACGIACRFDRDPPKPAHRRRLRVREIDGTDGFGPPGQALEPHVANDARHGVASGLPRYRLLPIGSSFGHSRAARRSSTIATGRVRSLSLSAKYRPRTSARAHRFEVSGRHDHHRGHQRCLARSGRLIGRSTLSTDSAAAQRDVRRDAGCIDARNACGSLRGCDSTARPRRAGPRSAMAAEKSSP